MAGLGRARWSLTEDGHFMKGFLLNAAVFGKAMVEIMIQQGLHRPCSGSQTRAPLPLSQFGFPKDAPHHQTPLFHSQASHRLPTHPTSSPTSLPPHAPLPPHTPDARRPQRPRPGAPARGAPTSGSVASPSARRPPPARRAAASDPPRSSPRKREPKARARSRPFAGAWL